ncbi:MAG: hypothetical protein ACI9WS_000534, partial [Paraglaciecola psychrophila]
VEIGAAVESQIVSVLVRVARSITTDRGTITTLAGALPR